MARTIPQLLRPHFPGRIRRAGERLAKDELAGFELVEGGWFRAFVEDPRSDEVDMVELGVEFDENRWSMSCTCGGITAKPCAHAWAAVVTASREFTALFEPWREGVPAGPGGAATAPGLTKRKARRAPEAEPEWRTRLRELAAEPVPPRDPWPSAEWRDWELRIILDVLEPGLPIFDWEVRRRRKNGGWGVWKQPTQDTAALRERLTSEDVDLLERLVRTDDAYGVRRDLTGPVDWNPEAAELLPELCRTGRLWLREPGPGDSDGELLGPLELDEGPAYRFALRLDREKGSDDLLVDLRCERPGESVSAREVSAFLRDSVLLGQRLAAFESKDALGLISLLGRDGQPLRVPRGQEAEALEDLADHVGGADIRCSDESLLIEESPRPGLEVESRGKELACTLRFRYGSAPAIRPEEPRRLLFEEERSVLLARDLRAERAALERFLELGGRRSLEDVAWGREATVRPSDLPGLVEALVREGWQVKAEGRRYLAPSSSKLRVSSGIDWLELEGELAFEEHRVPLPQLMAHAAERKGFIELGDGTRGLLPQDWLQRVGLVATLGEEHEGKLRYRSAQAALLDALLASQEQVDVDERFEELRRSLSEFGELRPAEAPEGFEGRLRGYQREGLAWLEHLGERGLGACLADDMGLGKTVQVLALLLARRHAATEARPSLVVAPRTLAFNWVAEARRFTPSLRVHEHLGVDRAARADEIPKSDLVVTTYGTLRRDAQELAAIEFEHVVLDEAQVIKNAASQASKAVRLLKGRRRLALTGTPVENHLGELWSLFEFLNPGLLGRSRAFQRLLSAGSGSELDAERRELLGRVLRPFLLRRTKAQVLTELPEKSERVVRCELEGRQRRDYDRALSHLRSKLLDESEVDLSRKGLEVLAALLRLRQLACHPGLLDEGRRGESSAKLDLLLPMLSELVEEGHAALVFSQFPSFLSILRERLDAQGLRHEYLDGQTRRREEAVARFQAEDGPPLFLVSLKAGGLGLNLTRADHVFVLDPWWNPAAESQAADRAHRLGQTRPVNVHRLVAKDTIEERVLELQERKRELAEAVLGQAGTTLRDLRREDLEALLS